MLKTTTFRIFPFLLVVLGLGSVANADEPSARDGSLTVRVSNIKNDRGQIGCSLYARKDGFPSDPEKAAKSMFVKPKTGKARCTFEGVKPGTYAVSVMHDENEDGELETSFVGRPKEWWGVSNDVPAERFGPPKYEKATFHYKGSAKTIDVTLQL